MTSFNGGPIGPPAVSERSVRASFVEECMAPVPDPTGLESDDPSTAASNLFLGGLARVLTVAPAVPS